MKAVYLFVFINICTNCFGSYSDFSDEYIVKNSHKIESYIAVLVDNSRNQKKWDQYFKAAKKRHPNSPLLLHTKFKVIGKLSVNEIQKAMRNSEDAYVHLWMALHHIQNRNLDSAKIELLKAKDRKLSIWSRSVYFELVKFYQLSGVDIDRAKERANRKIVDIGMNLISLFIKEFDTTQTDDLYIENQDLPPKELIELSLIFADIFENGHSLLDRSTANSAKFMYWSNSELTSKYEDTVIESNLSSIRETERCLKIFKELILERTRMTEMSDHDLAAYFDGVNMLGEMEFYRKLSDFKNKLKINNCEI
ncbi:hypothetical protein OAB57_00250 [Bacteriovoracaceae bacterium]|nr:hypothetical protein [Bacteriovoracaceae bacterium]